MMILDDKLAAGVLPARPLLQPDDVFTPISSGNCLLNWASTMREGRRCAQ
jgi:hypothetical protein